MQETVCRSDQARKLYRQEHYGPMVWGITRWFSQDVCGGNCKCAKPLINGIDCFFTAAPCIDYIKGYDRYEKSPSNCMFNGLLFHFGLKTVGLPRFELGQTEPKPVVLPLHHSPIIMCFPWKAVQRYVFPAI